MQATHGRMGEWRTDQNHGASTPEVVAGSDDGRLGLEPTFRNRLSVGEAELERRQGFGRRTAGAEGCGQ
jgi:hypothetical protein